MKLTIGIKALNEEKRIADALSSALAAAAPFGGEVILADSGSTDRTIETARQFPVRIVQLENRAERCCGAGAQLAFQDAKGEYFYLLDGDMTVDPGFMPEGIAFLDAHPDAAGVGGFVEEMETANEAFEIRAKSKSEDVEWRRNGEVDRLDCGGLYRAAAVREVGWFGDRNLHAFEEFDLGARLRSRGWKLFRIAVPAVQHYGHAVGGYHLLWRRLRSGYASAPGEVLKGAIGQGHLRIVLHDLSHIRHALVVVAWWAMLLASLFLPYAPISMLLLVAAPILFLSWRRGGPRLGLYSFASWNVTAIGLIMGLLRPRRRPDRRLSSVEIATDADPARPSAPAAS